jgi:hypothetical protein
MPVAILACLTIIIVTSIIAYSCVTYYTSNCKRTLVNAEERLRNLSELMSQKDRNYLETIKIKGEECQRLTDVIKSLTEKNQNYSVNAKINS